MREIEISEPPESNNLLTSHEVLVGESIPPLKRLKIFDSDQWEDITLELVSYWKTQYENVVRCGGGGDMGRDVISYSNFSTKTWENFQCKHYKNPLNLSQALLEIGKVLYYSFIGKFTVPQMYYFVAPLGVSTDLLTHLMDGEKLKSELIIRWDKCCKTKITSKKSDNIELEGDLLKFIQEINFDLFTHIPPIKIIELHSKTRFHSQRFGTVHKKRPLLPIPPGEVADCEAVYISELLKAFRDAEGKNIKWETLKTNRDYKEEYDSARKNFYAAENLEKFSRDWLPEGCYQDLLNECYESISSTVKSAFNHGYARYLATNTQASLVNYVSHPLSHYIKIQDKKGMCHQLVNFDRITWVKNDEL